VDLWLTCLNIDFAEEGKRTLKIAQITDPHLGAFMSKERLNGILFRKQKNKKTKKQKNKKTKKQKNKKTKKQKNKKTKKQKNKKTKKQKNKKQKNKKTQKHKNTKTQNTKTQKHKRTKEDVRSMGLGPTRATFWLMIWRSLMDQTSFKKNKSYF
jgi:hypothetical protein